MTRARKLRGSHMGRVFPPVPSRSSGTTNLMHFTSTSRQVGKSWAGMVTVFIPRACSWPLSSTSVRITASATRLPGQTCFKVRSSWRMRPWDSRNTSPRLTSTESWQPRTVRSTGMGHSSGWTTTSHSTVTVGSGKVTWFPSVSV